MAWVETHTVEVTTDSDGDATAYSSWLRGFLERIEYVKDDFDDGVDFTITVERTAFNLWTENTINASTTRAPRTGVHSGAGAALVYTSDNQPVVDRVALGHQRIKIVVANGGNTKSGAFHLIMS